MRIKVLIAGLIVIAVGIGLSRGIQHVHVNKIADPEIYGGLFAAAGAVFATIGAATGKHKSKGTGPGL